MNTLFYMTLETTWVNRQYKLKKLLRSDSNYAIFLADEVIKDRHIRQVEIGISPDASSEAEQNRDLQSLILYANLDHPHLHRCFTIGACNLYNNLSSLYIVMPMINTTLESLLHSRHLSEIETLALIRNIAHALVYLHGKGIAYLDLKPQNILYSPNNQWQLDYNSLITQLPPGTNEAKTDNPSGTLAYIAPEAFDGVVAPSSDMWALGIVIIEALTGELPYQSQTSNDILQAIAQAEVQIPELPKTLTPIVQGCLQPNREQRWTAAQVLAHLENG